MTEAKNKPNVLIVEDDSQLAEYLTDFIEDHDPGIRVQIASNGQSALDFLNQYGLGKPLVDIIILDLMMPGMDGIELCQHIKQMPHTCEIPIIAMTGFPSMENIDRVIEAGASAFMGKPLEPETLRAILRDLTHGRAA
jgi:CheY-like chemotaxis protein